MNRWLLLDGAGSWWAVGHDAVSAIERRPGGFHVRVTGGELAVDGVLGVVDGLVPTAAGGVLKRFWGESCGGLAVHAARPLVVVDPERPPAILARAQAGEEWDG